MTWNLLCGSRRVEGPLKLRGGGLLMVEVVEGKRRLEDGWRIWACSLIGIHLGSWLSTVLVRKLNW
jgi:hypothetical protein